MERVMKERAGKSAGEKLQAQWRARLARFSKASQSVAAFCAAESVSVKSYYYWRRKLSGETASDVGEARRNRRPNGSAPFIDAGAARLVALSNDRFEPVAAIAGIEVRIDLRDGIVLRIVGH
jgi:hypothetical protein